jgi:hypothetical protein
MGMLKKRRVTRRRAARAQKRRPRTVKAAKALAQRITVISVVREHGSVSIWRERALIMEDMGEEELKV